MTNIHHLNCVRIVVPGMKDIPGHCLLIEYKNKLGLVDTGIGLLETLHPQERIGQQLIDIVGFRFNENDTAIKQIEQLGFNPSKVTDCIISHLDPDHIGGLADFPSATVHVSEEEYEGFRNTDTVVQRYLPQQLNHNPVIKTYSKTTDNWFGFEARRIEANFGTEIFLIPLSGHTLGHCGIAIKQENSWLFFVGDAYYLRIELTDTIHPINELVAMRAENNEKRIESLNRLRKLINEHPNIQMFCYHDIEEFNGFL